MNISITKEELLVPSNMRVWDIEVQRLCRQHLLGQHRDIHAIHSIIKKNKVSPYQNHPEVKRWKYNLNRLVKIHEYTVRELKRRNYKHHSPLSYMIGLEEYGSRWDKVPLWQTKEEQYDILRAKGCDCEVGD